MSFTKRTKRFAHQMGKLLTTAEQDLIQMDPIDVSLCYQLIEENPQSKPAPLDQLTQSIGKIIKKYHQKTGKWLDQEQVAFAITWQNAKQQATRLNKHSNTLPTPIASGASPSPFKSSLLAEAVKSKQFITQETMPTKTAKPCVFTRELNWPLDEVTLSDIETVGREVRLDCEKTLTDKGTDLNNIEACWRLKLRYEGCTNNLTVKCMPTEMLKDVFEAQYCDKYGGTDKNRSIVIDELEIELRTVDLTPAPHAKASHYVEQWMSQWKRTDHCATGLWIKQDDSLIKDQFSWLECSVLQEMLEKLMTKGQDPAMPDFFTKNSQKGVDEVVMRN